MSATSIRGREWAFDIFWAGCGDPESPKCTVNIPFTSLFKKGAPIKSMYSDPITGVVKRVSLENVEPTRESTERGLRGEQFRLVAALRKMLIEYSVKNKYDRTQTNKSVTNEPFLCTVFYSDNQLEDLTLTTFDILIRNEQWRLQVLFIQGYVPASSTQLGNYSRYPQVRSKIDSAGAEAADQYTRAIAKYAEKAYTNVSGDILDKAKTKVESVTAAIKLKVTSMQAKFALDSSNKVIFQFCEYTAVEIENGRREIEDYLEKEKNSRESSAAISICNDLLVLLRHAQNRGLSVQESFNHFDVPKNGYIDTDLLVDGLARLGIGVTYPVGEAMLSIIGGIGAGFITQMDFEQFLMTDPDTHVLDKNARNTLKSSSAMKGGTTATGAGKGTKIKGATSRLVASDKGVDEVLPTETDLSSVDPVAEAAQPSRASKKAKVKEQLLPPLKEKIASDFIDLEASQQHKWGRLPPEQAMELPVPEAMYNTGSSAPRNNQSGSLPQWANKRTHRALNEIQKSISKTQMKGDGSVGGKANKSAKTDKVGSYSGVLKTTSSGRTLSSGQSSTKSGSQAPSKHPPPVEPLSLAGIQQEMTHELSGTPDELLHVDHGVVMTYRLVVGGGEAILEKKTHEESSVLRYKSVLEKRSKNLSQAKMNKLGLSVENEDDEGMTPSYAGTASHDTKSEAADTIAAESILDAKAAELREKDLKEKESQSIKFTLVVIPDMFNTLDSLQKTFELLLVKYPFAQILLVGLPGLPNTTWPKTWVLNSDLHSRSIAKLLSHLQSANRIGTGHARFEPIFFLGVGAGATTMARFVSLHLPGLPYLEYQTKACIIVNGMLKFNKKFKNICKDLRQSMINANAYEVNELITSLHFCDDYLAQFGRTEALDKFWATRRGLRMDSGATASLSAIHAKSASQQKSGSNTAGIAYTGVLEMLKGLLISPDDFDGTALFKTKVPLLVVQSTEDVFVDPRHAVMFKEDQLPEGRVLVSDMQLCTDSAAVHMSWLKAGHEVLQERTAYILGLVSSMAQLCHGMAIPKHPDVIRSEEELAHANKRKKEEEETKNLDVMESIMIRKKKEREENEARKKKEEEEEEARRQPAANSTTDTAFDEDKEDDHEDDDDDLYDGLDAEEESVGSESTGKKDADSNAAAAGYQAKVDQEAHKAKMQKRKKAEAKRRLELQAERKKREQRAARQAEMEIFYKRERDELERKWEARETATMTKEDRRSKFAAEYATEMEISEITLRIAKAKAEELDRFRREAAIKRVEETMARQRAERIEERRRKAAAIVEEIDAEQLQLYGAKNGGYNMPDNLHNVNKVIESSQRIMQDLLECRQKSVEAMQRQMLMEEKTLLFRSQIVAIEQDERRLRRAIRLIEINPGIVGKDINPEHELQGLRRSLQVKTDTLSELMELATMREAQLSAANRSIQNLKLMSSERDGLMKERINEMRILSIELGKRLKEMTWSKESLVIQVDKLRAQLLQSNKRVNNLQIEVLRVSNHQGTLIDTDVWVEGVLQRCVTSELLAHLKKGLAKANEVSQDIQTKVRKMRLEVFELSDAIAKVKRDADKITSATTIFHRTYQKFSNVSVMEIMKNLSEAQRSAQKIEEKRNKEDELEKLFLYAGSNTLADKVRVKESEVRTKDERKFVGIDLVLNPQAYLHLTVVEAEQMQFDEDYQCTLAQADLQRIYKLPEQINLALPFLHTAEEIEAHRLINKYLKELDENHFKNLDYRGPGSSFNKAGIIGDGASVDSSSIVVDSLMGDNTENRSAGLNDGAELKNEEVIMAEVTHDIMVRESLRDRIRATCYDEPLTEDEQRWLQLDKVLSPHAFDVNEQDRGEFRRKQHEEKRRKLKADAASQDAELLQRRDALGALKTDTSKAKSVKVNSPDDGKGAKKKKVEAGKDGDAYDDLRARFEDGEEGMFDDKWYCPYNRTQLLAIRGAPITKVREGDEMLCRRLMEHYYVDDNESTLGHARLKSLRQLNSKVGSALRKADNAAAKTLAATLKLLQLNTTAEETGEGDNGSVGAETLGSLDWSTVDGTKSTAIAPVDTMKRIWGSWNEVHPASAGKESQTTYFRGGMFDASRDHPASYALQEPDDSDEEGDDSDVSDIETGTAAKSATSAELRQEGMKALLGQVAFTSSKKKKKKKAGGDGGNAQELMEDGKIRNDPNSMIYICESISNLAATDQVKVRGKVVLLLAEEPLVVLEEDNIKLNARQSRSHYFTIPDRESVRAMDITVTIVFQGNFGERGYKLGRIAGSLFRVPPGAGSIPIPVGHSPYHLQAANLPTSMGRIVIVHSPKHRPLAPGTFQIVVGAASNTQYSIQVSARVGHAALPLVDKSIELAKQYQVRLPKCLMEIDGLFESLRLAERKLLVCEKMIQEAEAESDRCQRGMEICRKRLAKDDAEMFLMEEERRDLKRELGIFEVEYAQWASLFNTRNIEREAIKEGIEMIHDYQREHYKERDEKKAELDRMRRELPSCMLLLRTMTEAVNVASSLNTVVQGVSEEMGNATAGDFGGIQVSTPAADVRRQMKRFGFKSLSLEEQQWCVLDQALHPEMYEWKREAEEQEAQERELAGKPPKKEKFNASVENFRLSKVEIEYIMECPFSMLSRKEMIVRKLITKFHDDKEHMKKAISAVAYSFDPHLAERVRAKHVRAYSKEEKNWSVIDRKLHPEIWKYYVNRDDNFMDRHKKDAQIDHANKRAKRLTKRKKKIEAAPEPVVEDTKSGFSSWVGKVGGFSFGGALGIGSKKKEVVNADPSKSIKVIKDAKLTSKADQEKNASGKKVAKVSTKDATDERFADDVGPTIDGVSNALDATSSTKVKRSEKKSEKSLFQKTFGGTSGKSKRELAKEASNSAVVSLAIKDDEASLGEETLDTNDESTLMSDDEAEAAAQAAKDGMDEETFRLLQEMHMQGLAGGTIKPKKTSRRPAGMSVEDFFEQEALNWDKEHVMRIWRTPRHLLASDEEREAFRLLMKYNGSYSAYLDVARQAAKRKGHMVRHGAHIHWEKLGKVVSKDVDFRARQLLREIDRATFTKNEYIQSDVLHANDQRFPTRVLRMHLEEALDALLMDQIKDRERAEQANVESSDSEGPGGGAGVDDDASDFDADTMDADRDPAVLERIRKRALKREKRRKKLQAKQATMEQEVLKARKIVKSNDGKSGQELAESILQHQLGVEGCLACRRKHCHWRSSIDLKVCKDRKYDLDREVERVRIDRDSAIFESDVCLSAQLGGNSVFKRQDLLDELIQEIRDLELRIDLNNVDKELHDAYCSRKEYFESHYLHGYSILMWTNNARRALEIRRNRLLAMTVSKEVVDDILDWMLEGWYFGERESQFAALGYVPTLKKDGMVKAGQDQVSTVDLVVDRLKKRTELRRKGIETAHTRKGKMIEKAWEIELKAEMELKSIKVARDGNDHEKTLDETERTLKFGIFMMTLMYFRAMMFVKREQASWSGEGDEIGVGGKKGAKKKVMTDERLRMLDEESKMLARKKKVEQMLARGKVGEARRLAREAAERKEAIMRLQAVVRRQQLEVASICQLQKVYRGHLGRKAARRWALKKAELGAMNALLNSTAICIQRNFRGYKARCHAITKRMEMAQFIALMRVQESAQDEEIYWQTHPWSRFKRDQKDWWNQYAAKYRPKKTLGGSRLTEEEQARAEGKSIEEIRREIEGLVDVNDDFDGEESLETDQNDYRGFEEGDEDGDEDDEDNDGDGEDDTEDRS